MVEIIHTIFELFLLRAVKFVFLRQQRNRFFRCGFSDFVCFLFEGNL